MRLAFLRSLYRARGPFVSVYLDVSRDTENAPKEIELRWRAARETLAAQGADAATLDAAERAVGSLELPAGRPEGPQGQVIFAAGGRVVFTDLLPDPPRREIARFSPLPHAMPYLAQRGERIPYLRVVIDRLGADIVAVSADGLARTAKTKGDDYPVHKPRGGEWANRRYHEAAEHLWLHNAIDAAAEVERMALRSAAEVLVVSGDRQASRMMIEHLRESLRDRVVETESGSRADGSATAALDAELVRAARDLAARHSDAVLDAYQRELGQRDRATEGLADTVVALQRGQVETLLLNDDPSSVAELRIGPEPAQLAYADAELRELGVRDPAADRADAALVRALVGTDGELVTVPDDAATLTDGVGALLRYPL
ncbi:MAG: hypothetical protein GEV03_04775 [Streptosporangiales bacterium]|nr:hypothetical protein [Streptosporangiales bacterium]